MTVNPVLALLAIGQAVAIAAFAAGARRAAVRVGVTDTVPCRAYRFAERADSAYYQLDCPAGVVIVGRP
jgi:hypothetical protein